MFAKHQTQISEFARTNPENFGLVLKFVIVTIRNRMFNVPADMEILARPETPGELAGVLYGFKQDSIDQIEREQDSFYWQAEEIVYHAETEREAEENLLALFTGIHGLGLAKAGFACQLIYGVSACLDSHNLTRFGIPFNHMKSSTFKNAKRYATRQKWIRRYCDYVAQCGGTESLWDSWCAWLCEVPDPTGFKMNGNRAAYESPWHVSALHCESLGLTPA